MSYRVAHFEVFDDLGQWPAGLMALHAHWERMRGDRDLPSRSDFDPADVPQHLPDLVLVDITPDASDFRYRVVGTRVAEVMTFDRTGQSASEAYADNPSFGETLRSLVRRLQELRRPFAITAALTWVGREYLTLEASVLPLADDGDVTMALVECRFRPTKQGPGPPDAA